MAHAAEIDFNGVVLRVLVFDNSLEPNVEQFATELFGGTWIQTSFNGNFRKNYAGVGFIYDPELDEFNPPDEIASL